MSKYELHEIYSDLYYHELEIREKITNRLQLTFAFHATSLTVLAYMIRMIDFDSPDYLLIIFYVCISIFVCLLGKSIFETVRAFWGNTYKALASANDIEDFRNSCFGHEEELKKYKKSYPDQEIEDYCPEEKINNYLYGEFSKCASHNSAINDLRSQRIHKATKYLLFAIVPFLIASFCFTVFDMDTSSPRKRLLIEYQGITQSIDQMSVAIRNEIITPLKDTEEKNSSELIKAIESASDSIVHELKDAILTHTKETIMSDEKNEIDVPQDPPAPPIPPEPPQPRDIIDSQDPDIIAESEG